MTEKDNMVGNRAWFVFLAIVVGAAAICGGLALTPASVLQGGTVLVDHNGATSLVRLPVVHLFQRMVLAGALALLGLAVCAVWKKALFAGLAAGFARDVREYGAAVAGEVRELTLAENRGKLIALGLITAMGVILRLLRLDEPIRFDEAYTFNVHAATPFFNLISDYTTPNNHVFHSVLVRCSYLLFGDSPLAIRLPALVTGILIIPATFWCLRRVVGDWAAVLAAAFAAGSYTLISYSTNARGYSVLTLALLIVFSLATRLRDKRNTFVWTLFVIVLTLGFFTVPVMLYGACTVGIWLLLSAGRARRASMVGELTVAALSVAALTCALYTPIAVRVGVGAIVANPFVRPLPWDVFLNGIPNFLAGVGRAWATPWPLLSGCVVALVACFFARGDEGRESRRLHAAFWLTVPTIVLIQKVLPYSRVFVMFFPLGYGLVGLGTKELAQRIGRIQRWISQPVVMAVVGLVAILIPSFPHAQGTAVFGELPAIISELKPMLREGDVIVAAIPLNEPLRYHARRAGLPEGTVQELHLRDRLTLGSADTVSYMVEEKNPPRREFVTFSLPTFRIDHPFLKEHFEEPKQVFETSETRVFQMRWKSE